MSRVNAVFVFEGSILTGTFFSPLGSDWAIIALIESLVNQAYSIHLALESFGVKVFQLSFVTISGRSPLKRLSRFAVKIYTSFPFGIS